MKTTVAMACVVVAWFLFATSSLLLCDCPGYPAIGIPLATLAIWWLPGRRWRLASVLAFFACVFMTTTHAAEKFRKDQRQKRTMQRAAENAASSKTSSGFGITTNGPVSTSTNQ